MIAWQHIIKEMFSQKLRLWLTVFAIAWGTASIAGMLAIGEGLGESFSHALQGTGIGVVSVFPGQSTISYQGRNKGYYTQFSNHFLQTVKHSIPGIKAISASANFNADIKWHNQKVNAQPTAVMANYAAIRNITLLPGGRFITPSDSANKNRVVVIGPSTYEQLFHSQGNPVGQILKINGWPFHIIGVSQKKMAIGMMDNNGLYIPLSTYQNLSGQTVLNSLLLVPSNPDDSARVKKQLTQLVAFNNGLSPKDEHIVNFFDVAQLQHSSGLFFSALKIFLGCLGGITLLVAGVGVANMMTISIKNATRAIGVQMAIGARTYHILAHYLTQALCICLLGGGLGILFSYVSITLINLIPIHTKVWQMLGNPHPILSWSVLLTVVCTLTGIGFFAGFFPARRAAHIDPVEALRHE